MKNVTFLITYYAHPELLKVCLDSIEKYHSDSQIIISQQIEDGFNYKQGSSDRVKIEYHDMKHTQWAAVASNLMMVCQTDYAVFMEHDAFLLKSLQPLMDEVQNGTYDLIGPEEICLIRNSPGMIAQNFFIINLRKMREAGLEKIWVRDIEEVKKICKNVESGYGITQTLHNHKFMKMTQSGYGRGTFYDDYVHHLWYGSYKKRNVAHELNTLWMDYETERLIEDYWNGKISGSNNSI